MTPSEGSMQETRRPIHELPVRFSEMLLAMALQHGYLHEDSIQNPADALATLDYEKEKELKIQAFRTFWQACGLPGDPHTPTGSPLPRHYRTTSKRKALFRYGKLCFSMGYSTAGGNVKKSVPVSELELELHGKLYTSILNLLRKKHYEPLARALNYCIIRGGMNGHAAVILNIYQVKGEIVHKLKLFAEELKAAEPDVSALFMFVDETRSDYYLESGHAEKTVTVKKLFGPEMLDIKIGNLKLLYPPTVFSQINESMIPVFTDTVLRLLSPGKSTRVLDLYCGYGLFSMTAAARAGSVWGMDLEGPAISAAISNARHLYPGRNMKFFASAITEDSLMEKLPFDDHPEYVILDPPRNGTANGVIQTIAMRKPQKVLHIFCGTDQLPKELRIWLSCGYKIDSVKVLDMFPGTPNLETLILLSR